MTLRSVVCLAVALTTAAPLVAQSSPNGWGKGKRILILGGGSSHDFDKNFNTNDVATINELEGYTVRYFNEKQVAEVVQELPNVDVFITSTNDRSFIVPEMRKALFDFAAAGKGLIFIHPATWYNFPRDWPEYNAQLIGGGSKGHNMFREFTVTVNKPDHPVMRNVPKEFKVTDELYFISIDPNGTPVEVLATATEPDSTAKSYTNVWVVKHPKSKIVCIAMGHDEKAHTNPAFKAILKNAVEWTSGSTK